MNKTLCSLLDERQSGLGSTYQNCVAPGPRKLAQFKECLRLMQAPGLRTQEDVEDPVVRLRLFDPAGSWTWYITEWDGRDTAFGLVCGFEPELGYIDISELAAMRGRFGIGIELDMHFTPRPLSSVRSVHPSVA